MQLGTKLEEKVSDHMCNLFEVNAVVSIIGTLAKVYIIIVLL